MSYTYLASPYSHPDPAVVAHRTCQARQATAVLMCRGVAVFSPIAHTHDLVPFTGGQSHDFWMAQDVPLLLKASRVMVLCLDGWQESRGVQEEIRLAKLAGIAVCYMDENWVEHE